MSNLNIEVYGKKVVRLTVLPSGDVEVTIASTTSREEREKVIATIPQNRRELVAEFIKSAP